ncbi:hypothetical protein KC730_01960 [Candidatus Kaiserbacteria bacterium]|nr:hypothetical protein [Candidatus Kaiserbacteria bacterium]
MEPEISQTTQTENSNSSEMKESWYTPLTKITPLSKYLTLFLFLALPFLGFWIGVEFRSTSVINQLPEIVQEIVETPETVSSQEESWNEIEITYALEQVDPNAKWGEEGYFDMSIIKFGGGDKKVLVQSIKASLGASNLLSENLSSDISRYSFGLLSQPESSDTIIFYAFIPDSDGPAGPYYKYVESSNKIEPFSSSINFGWGSPRDISPNGRYVAGIGSDKQFAAEFFDYRRDVIVVDLLDDSFNIVAVLNEGETLVESYGFAEVPFGGFNWIDNFTLEYSVYSSTDVVTDEYGMETASFLEKRTTDLNSSILNKETSKYKNTEFGFSFEYDEEWILEVTPRNQLPITSHVVFSASLLPQPDALEGVTINLWDLSLVDVLMDLDLGSDLIKVGEIIVNENIWSIYNYKSEMRSSVLYFMEGYETVYQVPSTDLSGKDLELIIKSFKLTN